MEEACIPDKKVDIKNQPLLSANLDELLTEPRQCPPALAGGIADSAWLDILDSVYFRHQQAEPVSIALDHEHTRRCPDVLALLAKKTLEVAQGQQ